MLLEGKKAVVTGGIIGATARQPLNTAVTFKSMMFLNAAGSYW